MTTATSQTNTEAIYSKSLLQRAFRDVHAATQHVAVSPAGMEDVGRDWPVNRDGRPGLTNA